MKYQHTSQSLGQSEFSSIKSSIISGLNDDIPNNNCIRLFYRVSKQNKNFIICLRIYINELNSIFITIPNSIFLLYDKTSEESFKVITSYYEDLIKSKKFEKSKFILVGNKKDLIHEEEEKENEEIEEIKENEKNKENLINSNEKIENYCKEKNIILNKEISGLNGDGVMELFEEITILLYNDITNFEEDAKEFDVSLSFYKNIENELNLSNTGQSYYNDEYKKEINKINKKKRAYFCCYKCEII